jgi:hypothetical protein
MGITYLVAALKIDPAQPATQTFHKRVQSAFLFLSIGVNICATALIVVRLRRTDREMRVAENHLPHEDVSNTPYTKIAIVLVESALPFTIFGTTAGIAATLFAINKDFNVVTAGTINIILTLWINSCVSLILHLLVRDSVAHWYQALAPQVIAFRVVTGTSWISSPQRTRARTLTQSGPVFTTQLSQFMGPASYSQPLEMSKARLSAEELEASPEVDHLSETDRGG